LHKTFSAPHGGGGPGAGPVAANERLDPFLPVPIVGKNQDKFGWETEKTRSQTIGRLSANMGNAGVLLRAYVYARLLGREGMLRVAEFSTLNANYLMAELSKRGFNMAYSKRRATHEFVLTFKKLKDETGVSAMDVAKRLLDKGFHAPTMYFPLLVPECHLIEPTETEAKEELDRFVAAMEEIVQEVRLNPELVKGAPHTLPVKRLDDVRAARELNLTWKPPG
jgi:glycine dehydrogenase subunit 2